MSYVFKQPVTENQVKEGVTARQNQAALDALKSSIDAEENARANADANFSVQINQLQQNLAAEVASRGSDTAILAADLQTEKNLRTAADFTLETLINSEISSRNAAESALRDELNNALESEQAARSKEVADAVAAIKVAMGDDKALESIENDKIRAQIQEAAATQSANLSALESRLNDEEINRASEITMVRAEIAAEVAARQNADSQLQNSLSAAINKEVADRKSAISATEAALDTAQKNLAAAINKETADRKTAISGVETALDNAQKNLNAAVNKEIADRKTAISAAESALQNSISESAQNLRGVVNSEIATTKTYIDAQISAVEGNLNDFTAPTATNDGTRGLVPAPPAKMFNGILTTRGWRTPDDTTLTIANVPAQVGSLTFNGESQSPAWINFDEKKLKISGQISASDAGTFTATFTPLDIYLWADTLDQQPKTATWKIGAMKLTKPAAAVTNFIYNRAAQGLNVSNFDATYESQSGVISATDAAVYRAVFSLKNKNNTHWSDDSTDDVIVNWQIQPLLLTKPSAAVTEFTYNRNAQTLAVDNFDSVYESQTGTVSAADAATYTATYKLKNATNTHWADDSTADVSISWKIKPLLLTKPAATVNNFTFDGTAKSVQIANFDSTYESQTGTVSATNAGNYTATYQLKNKTNTHWADDSTADVNISWKIEKLKLAKPTAAVTEFYGDGTDKTLDVSNFNDKWMTESGTKTASSSGDYSVTYSLKDAANTTWEDDSTAPVTLDWKISLIVLTAAQSSNFKQVGTLTYNKQAQSPEINNFNADYLTLGGDTSATDFGTYSINIDLKQGYVWNDLSTDTKVVSWKIARKDIDKTTLATSTFEYDGAEHSPALNNFDPDALTLSSHTAKTDAGTYTLKVTLTNNYKWSGTTNRTVLSLRWYITKKSIAKPTCGTTQFTYDGNEKSITINGVDSATMTESGTKAATDAGDYSAKVRLNSTANYQWDDATTAAVTFDWNIARKKLTKAQSENFAQAEDLTFGNSNQSVTIKNYDATIHTLGGTLSAQSPGTYTATIAPTKNFCWNDGTFDAKEISWTIKKLGLNKPTFKDTWVNPTYNDGVYVAADQAKTFYVSNTSFSTFTLNYFQLSGDTSASQAGTYSVTLSLKEPKLTYWIEDGSTDDLHFEWRIEPLIIPEENSPPNITLKTDAVFHTGAPIAPEAYLENILGSVLERYVTQPCAQISYTGPYTYIGAPPSHIGTYQTILTPWPNCAWFNWQTWTDNPRESISFTWQIVPYSVPTPYATVTEFEYDGNNHTLDVKNYDSSLITRTGTVTAKAIGKYSLTFKLKDKTNSAWANGGTDDIVIEWSIGLSKIAAPVLTTPNFTYDGNAHEATFDGVDSAKMSISGTTSATNAGSYTVSFSLTNKDMYCWDDGSNDDRVYIWKIARQTLPDNKSTFSQAGTLDYNAQTQSVTIQNYDANYHTLGGTYNAVNAGTYTAKISTLPNYQFSDGSTVKNVSWAINQIKLVKPTVAVTNFTYDKAAHELNISNFNDAYESRSGTISATNEGSYSVTFSLKNKNSTSWADGSTADITVAWNIAKVRVTKPTASTTTFTYDGKAKNLSPAFDSNFVAHSGTVAETNAGSYSVTFSLKDKDLTVWEDGTTADVIISWTIARAKLSGDENNPYQSKDFSFSGNAFSILNANYLAGYSTAHVYSGTTSATDAGEYTAYVEPDSNHCWADSSVAKKTVQWKISRATIAAPTVTGTLTFNESEQSPTLSGYDASAMVLSGDTAKTDAGDYILTVTPDDNHCWQDSTFDSINLSWQIKPIVVPLPEWRNYYDQTWTLGEYYMYPPKFAETDESWLNNVKNFNADLMTVTGDSTFKAGAFNATFTLKTGYSFSNSGIVRTATLPWTVNKLRIVANTSRTALEYTGEAQELPQLQGYGQYFYGSTAPNKIFRLTNGRRAAKDIGNYSATIYLIGGAGSASATLRYELEVDGVLIEYPNTYTFGWSIGVAAITAPALKKTDTFAITTTYFGYDGQSHAPEILNFDSATMTKSGVESATEAGFYQITFALKDKEKTCWSTGGAEDIVLEWGIGLAKVKKPTFTETETTYDGTVKYASYSGWNVTFATLTGHSATDAGTYTAKISLISRYNTQYVWDDGSRDDITWTWKINPKPLPEVTLRGVDFVFDGKSKRATIEGYDAATMDASSTNWDETNAGTYSVQIQPKSNYCWSDGSTTLISVPFQIRKKSIARPYLGKYSFDYTGNTITPQIKNFDSDWMDKAGTFTATASGTYTMIFSLKDTKNTQWSSNSTDPIIINWTIGSQSLAVPTVNLVSQYSKGINESHSVTVSGFNSALMSMTGDTSVNTGKPATYTLTFSLLDKEKTAWDDGSTDDKKVTWQVMRKVLAPAESTFAQDSPLVWEDSTDVVYYYQIASALKAEYFGKYYCHFYIGMYKNEKPGTYTNKIQLTDAACWYDGSTADKDLVVTIDKAQFPYEFSAGGNINSTNGVISVVVPYCNAEGAAAFIRKAVSDGQLSVTATSSNPDVLTVQSNGLGHIILGVVKNGAATVTVKLASDYYVVPETITFNYTIARRLEYLSWSEIAELASAGTLSQYANIGDSVKVAVKGTVGTLDIDGSYNAVLIGIDHNAAREGSNRAHFAVLNAFTDKFYNTDVNGLDDADKAFAFSSYSNNGEEHLHFYNESIIRNRCTEFFNALPAELRTAISPVRKPFYGTNITQNADGSNSYTPYFSYTNDNVFIPSPFEVFGKTVNSHGQSAYYQQYDYWANGNSTNFGKSYWLRDRDFQYVNNRDSFSVDLGHHCYATDSGALSMSANLDRSFGLIFCFSVGG